MPEPEHPSAHSSLPPPRGRSQRVLDWIEWAGNKLPDPAVLFVIALLLTWLISALLAPVAFSDIDPRTIGTGKVPQTIAIKNQLTGEALTLFLSRMVKTFTEFPPLGVVLVAMLGVGIAEHTGFLNAGLKGLLSVTPGKLLTPMVLLVSILSHTAGDTGYVLVIPLGGVIFLAAGRHPLVGIVAAFAGISGGFSANFLPSALDPLLQGFTQSAAQIIDPGHQVNPLCNWGFMSASSLLLILLGWYLTDSVIEPRLRGLPLNGDHHHTPSSSNPGEPPDSSRVSPKSAMLQGLTPSERRGLTAGLGALLAALLMLCAAAWPTGSPLRAKDGGLTTPGAPLMEAIVPLIFLIFLMPSVVYGYAAGTVKSHRDIVQGMSKSMSTLGYYLVLAFFAAQFTYAFRESNVGTLLAVKGASLLQWLQLPSQVTIVGIIVITVLVDLLVGSASAKWAIMAPIFVPMLMQVGLSPELTQAAYRIGDSTTNIITPLMPYFPLIVVFCQRYVKSTGIGTLMALMVPYSLTFLVTWTVLLIVYWMLNIPLGLQASYTYPQG
jgi:aminobenzoyl-glutamate transport protein